MQVRNNNKKNGDLLSFVAKNVGDAGDELVLCAVSPERSSTNMKSVSIQLQIAYQRINEVFYGCKKNINYF